MASRKWKNQLKTWFANHTDLPSDIVLDLPRITLIGQLHIYIENHRGVLAFSNDELRLSLEVGQLLIHGHNFVLKTILPEEILLEGTIQKVEFIESR
ncbi:sporulation protein YqfC [Pullulanibacillus pueri]|uniref:Sporulation protein YqfC n=1 Tax=Pullulanibacillus pueri TaxID=1437324 RepID=A0A8J3EMZ5_9BACL|nr:sporulation protein YqfC [Pullulanibacillus pueri]MBM7683045.1 sporulation protein YqfC [Pullulanibacillus pueri]GGH84972.1 sporulation protein YqfC [Pullulanibacillus pueri]